MTEEEFQKIVLQELTDIKNKIRVLESGNSGLEGRFDGLESKFDGLEGRFDGLENRFDGLENRFDGLENRFEALEIKFDGIEASQKRMEIRQDEMYQVLRAIEHSNQVGRSEMDSHSTRLAKVEGKLKKAAQAFTEDVDVDSALNL